VFFAGIASVREPEERWSERGVMPFRKVVHTSGEVWEAPFYLFKIVNLRNPTQSGPIRAGDPVWFQVVQGRGETGWLSGSVLGSYMQGSVPLDSTAVDMDGKPPGFHVSQHMAKFDKDLAKSQFALSANASLFGLPEHARQTLLPSILAADHEGFINQGDDEDEEDDSSVPRPKKTSALLASVAQAKLMASTVSLHASGSLGPEHHFGSSLLTPYSTFESKYSGTVGLSEFDDESSAFVQEIESILDSVQPEVSANMVRAPQLKFMSTGINPGLEALQAGIAATKAHASAMAASSQTVTTAVSTGLGVASVTERTAHLQKNPSLAIPTPAAAPSPLRVTRRQDSRETHNTENSETFALTALAEEDPDASRSPRSRSRTGSPSRSRSGSPSRGNSSRRTMSFRIEKQGKEAKEAGDTGAHNKSGATEPKPTADDALNDPLAALAKKYQKRRRSLLFATTSPLLPATTSAMVFQAARPRRDSFMGTPSGFVSLSAIKQLAGSVLSPPPEIPFSMRNLIQSMSLTANSVARINALDRLRDHLGLPVPMQAYTPALFSQYDYLHGPATKEQKTGIYRRNDPGFEILSNMINSKPIASGKWMMKLAAKEISDHGHVIGALGLESTGATSTLQASSIIVEKDAARIAAATGGAFGTAKLTKKDVFDSSADAPNGAGAGTGAITGGQDDAEDGEGRKGTKKKDKTEPFLLNFSEIYVEKEWYYISCESASSAGDASNIKPVEEAPGPGRSHGHPPEMNRKPLQPAAAAVATEAHYTNPSNAIDSSSFVHQPGDGASGGNRRTSHLAAHVAGQSGSYKVERRGVFRLRLLNAVSSDHALSREEEIGLRAELQLKRSERRRLGEAVDKRAELDAHVAPNGAPLPKAGKPFRNDVHATANLARNLFKSRVDADNLAYSRYVQHEEDKAKVADAVFRRRLTESLAKDEQEQEKALHARGIETRLLSQDITIPKPRPMEEVVEGALDLEALVAASESQENLAVWIENRYGKLYSTEKSIYNVDLSHVDRIVANRVEQEVLDAFRTRSRSHSPTDGARLSREAKKRKNKNRARSKLRIIALAARATVHMRAAKKDDSVEGEHEPHGSSQRQPPGTIVRRISQPKLQEATADEESASSGAALVASPMLSPAEATDSSSLPPPDGGVLPPGSLGASYARGRNASVVEAPPPRPSVAFVLAPNEMGIKGTMLPHVTTLEELKRLPADQSFAFSSNFSVHLASEHTFNKALELEKRVMFDVVQQESRPSAKKKATPAAEAAPSSSLPKAGREQEEAKTKE
jgi:hypothetical protein